MASEQIVDDNIWDSTCAKKRTFNEFLIEHQGDAIVFLCGDRQIGTLKSIIFDSINSAEALSFETVVSDGGYTHTDPFAQPYIKIILNGTYYYISYADSEFILESPQFWRLTPVGKFKNSERQICLTYVISQYVPIIMNLGGDSESDVEPVPVAAAEPVQASAEVSTAALETQEAKEQEKEQEKEKEKEQDTKTEALNQTRRLRIVKDFLRRTLKVKRA
jgi:hypothetical protein